MEETGASAEEKELFKTKGQVHMTRIMKNFGDYEAYIGEAGPTENDDQQ